MKAQYIFIESIPVLANFYLYEQKQFHVYWINKIDTSDFACFNCLYFVIQKSGKEYR